MKTFSDGLAILTELPNPKQGLSKSLIASFLMGSLLVVGSSAQAATKTWDGGGATNNLSDGINWVDDTAPVAGDTLVFAGSTQLTPFNDYPSGTQFNGISFDATAGSFSITGPNAINLGGDLTDASAAAQSINVPLTLLQNTNVSVVSNGNLTLITAGATGTAVLTSGSVSSVNVTTGGFGYAPNSSIPVTFAAAPTGGTTATGNANTDANGVVTSITVVNGGSGYSTVPAVTIPSPADVADDSASTPRSLTKVGAGTLFLSGRNTFSGGLNINEGTVSLASPIILTPSQSPNGQQGAGTGAINFGNGATLTLNGATGNNGPTFGVLNNALFVPAGVAARINTSQRGVISSTLTGAGTLNIYTAFVRSDLSGNFTAFTGTINIFPSSTGGDVRLASNTVFGNNTILNLGSGVNILQSFNPPSGTGTQTVQTIGELNGVAGSQIGGNPVTGRFFNLTVGGRNTNSAFAGIIKNTVAAANTSGATRLTKVGTGTLTLTGANTYTGTTTVNNGTLAGTGALGFIASGATTAASATTFNTGSTHAPGVGTIPTGTQPVNGNYTLNQGSTLRIGSQAAQVKVTGTVTIGSTVAETASTVNLVVTSGFASASGDKFTIIDNDGTDAVVGTFANLPEGTELTSTDGTVFTISYVGGTDANDVVLTVVTPGSATGSSNSFGRISEFRTSGPSGINDEFIEIFNTTEAPLDLAGFSVVAGGVTVPIPAGKAIPARGSLLLTNSTTTTGYSLDGSATGDVTFTGDIADKSTVELRNAAGATVDLVDGATLAEPTAFNSNYSYVRRMDSTGFPLDTDNDANDFNTVDVASTVGPNNTTGVSNNIQRLGAPGPQNLASAVTSNALISFVQSSILRTGSGNSGTLALRSTITNRAGSGRTITSLRFRMVGITAGTTSPAGSAPADIRPISSTSTDGTNLPLILQQPPAQTNGGGLNSTVSLASLPGGGLAPGQGITVEFLFNIFQKGTYRYLINFEPVTTQAP